VKVLLINSKMAGWKPYLDLVMKGDGVKDGGIFGQDGAPWSVSPGFSVTPPQVKAIVEGIKDNAKLQASGVTVGSNKFMFLRPLSDSSIIAKKGPTSLMAILSKKAIIIVTTKDGANPANITSHDFVAQDLIKKGF